MNLGWTASYPDLDFYDIPQYKYHERFEMWYCIRTVKFSLSDRVTKSVTVKEVWNCVCTVRRSKANWIGHILHRKCVLKHAIEVKVQGTRRLGRRRKQLDHMKDTSGN